MIGLIIGHSGCGKSTFIKEEIINCSLPNTIISPELTELRNKNTVENLDYDFYKHLKFKPNHIYILDDAFSLDLELSKNFSILRKFFVRARKFNTHIFIVVHEIGQIENIRYFTYFTHIIGFSNEFNMSVQMMRLKDYQYVIDFLEKYNKKKLKLHEKIIHSRY